MVDLQKNDPSAGLNEQFQFLGHKQYTRAIISVLLSATGWQGTLENRKETQQVLFVLVPHFRVLKGFL